MMKTVRRVFLSLLALLVFVFVLGPERPFSAAQDAARRAVPGRTSRRETTS